MFELLNNNMVSLQFENTGCYLTLQKTQKKLILCHCLFEKYRESFQEVISPTITSDLFKVGWVTFVLLARQLPSSLTDFVESANCLINYMILLWKVTKDIRISETIEELYSICHIPKERTDIRYDDFIQKTLKDLGVDDLLETLTKTGALNAINQVFDGHIDSLGSLGFDERIFLYRNDINFVGEIPKLASSPVFQLNPAKTNQNTNDPFRSPMKSPGIFSFSPQTPLHASLYIVQLIEDSMKHESETPDETLQTYFKSCSTDQTPIIENRLKSLVDKINFSSLFDYDKEKRRREACKIYYNSLKHMLQAEEKRLSGTANFSTLLSNENFHRSLTACAAECISFSYNSKESISLVELLNDFALEPFELSIVIESFVQNAIWLNSSLKRHFKNVEESLLDCLAWKKNSILYSKLQNSSVPQPPKPGNETPNRQSNPETFGMYSPRKQPSAPKGSYSVQFFFRKMYKLVSRRIQELCYHFNQTQQTTSEDPMIISMDLMEQVWHIVYYVLNDARSLMVNRHVDHVIMCSMYAVCNKVNRMRLSFKDIIFNYRLICENNRYSSPVEVGKILWQVPLDKEGEFGDIVKFYNSVYIPVVKSFILDKTSGNSLLERPEMPYVDVFAKTKIAPNFVLSPRKSQYPRNPLTSPLRSEMNSSLLLTPRTKALYEFGSCSTKKHFDKLSTPTPQPLQQPMSDFSKRGVKRTLDFGDEPANTVSSSESSTESDRKFIKIQTQNK